MKTFKELFPHTGPVFPNTSKVADRVIVVPMGTAMPEDAVATIAHGISAIVAAARA